MELNATLSALRNTTVVPEQRPPFVSRTAALALPPSVIDQARGVAGQVTQATGLVLEPEIAILITLLALFLVLCCTCAVCTLATRTRRSRRARANALIVEMAEHAPVDDGDEHEEEKHSHTRPPAPGDSDVDDDLTPGSRSIGRPGVACCNGR